MSTANLREAALALLNAQAATLPERLYLMPALRSALEAPPPDVPDVPEVRRQIASLLDRHLKVLAPVSPQAQYVQQKLLECQIEDLVSLWERS